MIRSFNYTARQRLSKTHAVIHLRPDGTFDADLNLTPFELPDAARVYLEAYFKGTLLRFDFGAVGQLRPPADRRLTPRLPQPEVALFRLKVVAAEAGRRGLVLASGERILPRLARGGPGARQPLFRTHLQRLEAEVWRLEFDDDGPILNVDPTHRETARADAAFAALVYPDVVRRILGRVLGEHDDPDTLDDWRALWLRFGRQLTGEPNPPREDPAAGEDWINQVVARFVERHKLLSHYQRAVKPEAAWAVATA